MGHSLVWYNHDGILDVADPRLGLLGVVEGDEWVLVDRVGVAGVVFAAGFCLWALSDDVMRYLFFLFDE